MGGFDVLGLFIGLIFGNLGAVLIRSFNIGLLGNSIAGATGGALYIWGLPYLGVELSVGSFFQLAAGGFAGLLTCWAAGALVALRYRE